MTYTETCSITEEKGRYAAVRALLDDPSYRTAAGRVALDLSGHDAAAESADLLERLAATGRPVYA